MAIEFRARYANGALVPLEPLDLEEGSEALVTILAASPPPQERGEAREVGEQAGAYAAAAPVREGANREKEWLRALDAALAENPRPEAGGGAAAYAAWVQQIQEAIPPEAWEGGPTDLAKNKKHYLYGHPKEGD